MTYSATLDFSAVFGSPRACPACGADSFDELPDVLMRCGGCGAHWGPTEEGPGVEERRLP